MTSVKIVTLNVRGLRDTNKRKAVFNWSKKNKFDIVFLQETYSSQSDENIWEREWGNAVIWSHGSKHSRGVAIVLGKNINIGVDNIHRDNNGRLAVMQVSIEETKF